MLLKRGQISNRIDLPDSVFSSIAAARVNSRCALKSQNILVMLICENNDYRKVICL